MRVFPTIQVSALCRITMSHKIRIAGIVNDSIVDGLGFRLTIFTQGCLRRCPGCHNPQTHDFNGGETKDIDEIIELVRKNPLLDGVTLSGGEPFAQATACAAIAKAVHSMGLNVWCYTGYTFEELLTNSGVLRELLNNIDVLVDGPFIEKQKTLNSRFRGSSNQRIIDVSASLREGRAVVIED